MPKTRSYNTLDIDTIRAVVRKSSATDRLYDELQYHLMLPPRLGKYFPRIFDWDSEPYYTGRTTWFEMEFYDYPDVGSSCIEMQVDMDWWDFLLRLKTILDEIRSETPSGLQMRSAESMYKNKTEQEFSSFAEQRKGSKLCTAPSLVINDVTYPNFRMMWNDVWEVLGANIEYVPEIIHGDLCFSNILCSANNRVIKLIDPRGSFGPKGILGDSRYDIAKLAHSVYGGYEWIIHDRFAVKVDSATEFHYARQEWGDEPRLQHLFFNTFLTPQTEKIIRLIEGCIWIGMCARHNDNQTRQTAMYLMGIKTLHDALEL